MDDETYETTRITITRTLGPEGDHVLTEWSEDASAIELLGMLEFARDNVLHGPDEDDD